MAIHTKKNLWTELISFIKAMTGFVFFNYHFDKEAAEIMQDILIKNKWSVHT